MTKMTKKWNEDWTHDVLRDEIVAALSEAKLCKTSPVGSGRYVHVRTSWKDASGSRKVTVCSEHSSVILKPEFNVSPKSYIYQTFGLLNKSVAWGAPSWVRDVADAVLADPAAAAHAARLAAGAKAAFVACCRSGSPDRRVADTKAASARVGLRSWTAEALKAGLSLEEIKSILNEEVARSVQES